MRSLLIHEDTRQQFDLAGFVDPAVFQWLESVRGYKFRCGQCQGLLYLRHNHGRPDRLHGVHQSDQGCHELVVRRGAPMTDEHKRECEYHALAAQAAGLSADFEFVTSEKTRVDVVVDGRLGFEIQHSDLSVDAVRGRTARSMSAGLETVSWFTDRQQSPLWYGLVPSYGTTLKSWDKLPRLGTVMAYGPRIVEAVTCRYDTFSRCPDGKPRPCGRSHWKDRNVSLRVDDVVTQMAAGELLPARLGKYVRLTDRASIALYEELTGRSALYGTALPSLRVPETPDRRIECMRPVVHLTGFPGTQLEFDFSAKPNPPSSRPVFHPIGSTCNVPDCQRDGRLYMAGYRCLGHPPQPYLRKAG